MSANNFVELGISENMEDKEPEVSNAIQNASHRIYHEMLKNVEHTNEYEIDDIQKEKQEQIMEERNSIVNTTPLNINDFQKDTNCLNEMASNNFLMDKKQPFKPPRPPPILRPSSSANEELTLQQKNVISSAELSEGEAAASRLQDLRLINKGLSKSVATNLNGQLHFTSNEECPSPNHLHQNSTIPREAQTAPILNPSNGTFILTPHIVCRNGTVILIVNQNKTRQSNNNNNHVLDFPIPT